MLRRPELVAVTERVRDRYLADPVNGGTPAGRASAAAAAASIVAASAGHAIVSAPARPFFYWGACAPHAWRGHQMPGSGYGIDNPDNVHRRTALDGVSTYRIRGRVPAEPAAQFSFICYGGEEGVLPVAKEGAPIADVLLSSQIETDAEGRFEVTIGPQAVKGSPHHLTSVPATTWLLVRDTLTEWAAQDPLELSIQRVSGPAAPPAPTSHELAQRAVAIAERLGEYWLAYDNKFIFTKPVNELNQPRMRPFGAATSGHFALRDDHGLLLVVDPVGSDYVGVEVADPWGVTRPSVEATGGLNNSQVRLDDDGLLRYWIGPSDPGVHNWIDTGGLDSGIIAVRWQRGEIRAERARPVVESRQVPMADALTSFAAVHRVSAADRADQLRRRRTSFERRLT